MKLHPSRATILTAGFTSALIALGISGRWVRGQLVWKMAVDNDDHDPTKPYWVHWDVGPRAPLAR